MQIKPTTRLGYRQALDKHVLPRRRTLRIADVAQGEVQAWVAELSKYLEPSMVRQTYLVLACILRYAVRDDRLSRNVAEAIQLPRTQKRRHGYLNHPQVKALAKSAVIGPTWWSRLPTPDFCGARLWRSVPSKSISNAVASTSRA